MHRRKHPGAGIVLPTAPGLGVSLGAEQGCKEGVIPGTGLGKKTSASWQMLLTWAGLRKTEVTKPCCSLRWETEG